MTRQSWKAELEDSCGQRLTDQHTSGVQAQGSNSPRRLLGQLLASFVSTPARYASGLMLCNLHVSINEASIAEFSTKSRDALARAKEYEARVDRMLSDLQRAAEGPSAASDQAT
jgi:hypothetical protein